jgi:hypothetical protein
MQNNPEDKTTYAASALILVSSSPEISNLTGLDLAAPLGTHARDVIIANKQLNAETMSKSSSKLGHSENKSHEPAIQPYFYCLKTCVR